jgi:hypothetical protein
MQTAIVILDGVEYEVPEVVADRMSAYYNGAQMNLAAYKRLHDAVTELVDKEHKACLVPLKANKLDAHYAKKHLYRMVGRQLLKRTKAETQRQ